MAEGLSTHLLNTFERIQIGVLYDFCYDLKKNTSYTHKNINLFIYYILNYAVKTMILVEMPCKWGHILNLHQ